MMLHTRLVVVDGNPLLYRNYYSPGTRNLITSDGRRSGGFYGFLRSYISLRKQFPSSYFIITFDDGDSGRNAFFSGYKANKMKDGMRSFSRQLFDLWATLTSAGVPVLWFKGIEADDMISVATHQWTNRHEKNSVVIVSSDRDFLQLVTERIVLYDDKAGKFHGPKQVFERYGVQAEHYLWYKCLVGDASDQIPGILGVGPKKAQALAPLGMLAVNGEACDTFLRNQRLMQCPKSFRQLAETFRFPLGAKRLDTTVLETLRRLEDDDFGVDRHQVWRRLRKYECHSITVNELCSCGKAT